MRSRSGILGQLLLVTASASLLYAAPTNVLVNDPSTDGAAQGFTQSETSMVVFGNTVVVGFNDTGSAAVGNGGHGTGYARSTDGGLTFTDLGALPDSFLGDSGDPSLARDAVSGNIYFAALATGVFRSTDGGLTFAGPLGQLRFLDRQTLAVDNFAGTGQGNLYLVGSEFLLPNGLYLYRSVDGGMSFNPAAGTLVVPGCADVGCSQGAWVTVGLDHSVYMFWWDDRAGTASIMMRRSKDQGLTFGPATTVAMLNTMGVLGDLGLPFRTDAFPKVVVNPVSGDLYAVYNDRPGATGDRGDIFFTTSNDGGNTWSVPARVNSDTTTNDQWEPTIAVTTDGTRLGVFWYDRRLDAENVLIDYFGRVATISGSTVSFQPDFRVTDQSFPPVFGVDPGAVPDYMGDYDTAQADACNFYVSWGDNRLPTAPDVRFAKIALCTASACPLGQGYWKNHPDAWPVHSLTLGAQTYSQTELLSLLQVPPARNASVILAQRLIAALLNVAQGADATSVADAIDDANALFSAFTGKLPYPVTPSSPAGQAMLGLADVLGQYNSGRLTPSCVE